MSKHGCQACQNMFRGKDGHPKCLHEPHGMQTNIAVQIQHWLCERFTYDDDGWNTPGCPGFDVPFAVAPPYQMSPVVTVALSPTDAVVELTRIVREADREFESVGGSSRHWVRDCFLPRVYEAGFQIVRNK